MSDSSAYAKRIEARVTWADLHLPADQTRVLQDLCRQARDAATVAPANHVASESTHSRGLTALFAGDRATATKAAEVVAGELGSDLLVVDLSRIVSKWIGETEKNLQRAFEAAERGGVVLFFDEADALFGKRTETKDARDRFANFDIGYLLDLIESYSGVAIVTSNRATTVDPAIWRRFRLVLELPDKAPRNQRSS